MSITTKEMKLVPVERLVPYVNNARTHSPKQINKLRSSIREFGFINPVIIDRDYGVIAGHGRILAATAEGIKEVPCVFADHLTEAQKKAYILADNRMALDAGWDEELLRVEIEALQAEAFDLSLTGFDEKELSHIFDTGNDVKDDEFDVSAELQKPTFTKAGDVWTLGRHRLVCGDSTKAETYAILMQDRKANLVITDPPYNVNYEGTAGRIQNDNMADDRFYAFLLDAFTQMEKAMASDASIYNSTFNDVATFIDNSDPIQVVITSTGGDVFKNGQGSTTLKAVVYQAGTEIDADGKGTYSWTKYNKDGVVDTSWGTSGTKTGKTLSVSNSDVTTKATFMVVVTI